MTTYVVGDEPSKAGRKGAPEPDSVDLSWLAPVAVRFNRLLERGRALREAGADVVPGQGTPPPTAPAPASPSAPSAAPTGEGPPPAATKGEGPPPADVDGPDGLPGPEQPTSPASSQWADVVALISHQRYRVLCGALLLMIVSYLLKFTWPSGLDLWEHSAAAREFSARPFSPRHPLLSTDAPHQFMNPYAWVIGVFSRLTTLSVVTVFNIVGVANLVLLFVGLRLFVRRVVNRPHADFYALLFMVLLWGPGAWFFSGFLHLNVLASVMAYPSTLAKGLAFLCLWAHTRFLDTGENKWLVWSVAVPALLWLVHPVDGIFLAIGLLALSVTLPTPGVDRRALVTLAALAASGLVALTWPFFSLWDLLVGEGVEPYRVAIAGADRDMYTNVLARLGPALIVLPFLAYRLRGWRSDPLLIMLAGTLAAYWYGWLAQNWSYGRLISSAHVVAAIILADERSQVDEAAGTARRPGSTRHLPWLRWAQVTTLGLVLIGAYHVRNGFSMLPDAIVKDRPYHWVRPEVDLARISDYEFLEENRATYPIAISDVYTSLEPPTFGVKVVAYARAQAFADTSQRGPDLNRFFEAATTNEVREEIIRRYDVALVVLKQERLVAEPGTFVPMLGLGPPVGQNDRFVFVDVRAVRDG